MRTRAARVLTLRSAIRCRCSAPLDLRLGYAHAHCLHRTLGAVQAAAAAAAPPPRAHGDAQKAAAAPAEAPLALSCELEVGLPWLRLAFTAPGSRAVEAEELATWQREEVDILVAIVSEAQLTASFDSDTRAHSRMELRVEELAVRQY